jgi:hypothetical protein
MDTSQAEQITRAAPVWVWDGYWWPAVVADVERSGGFFIVRFENGVTVPAQKVRLQPRDPTLMVMTSLDVPADRASRAVQRSAARDHASAKGPLPSSPWVWHA